MKYSVDLEKKEIIYDDELPGGHLIALKKIFEPQGFKFMTTKEYIKLQEDELESLKFKDGAYTYPYTYKGATYVSPTTSFKYDILDVGDSTTAAPNVQKITTTDGNTVNITISEDWYYDNSSMSAEDITNLYEETGQVLNSSKYKE